MFSSLARPQAYLNKAPDFEILYTAYEKVPTLTFSAFCKVLLFVLLAVNLKNLPFIYHLRILNGIRFVLRSQRSAVKLTPGHLFLPMITSSKATLLEMDVFGHKNNSTYFSDLDIARTHFVSTVFGEAIETFRGSTTMNGLSGKPRSSFTMPLGAVSCCFRKEIKPYETYDMWTRILSWDGKWFYLVTHFIKRSAGIKPQKHLLYPRQNGTRQSCQSPGSTAGPDDSAVCASALSKVVFKDGRKTIPPQTMLELAGLLPAMDHLNSTSRNPVEAAPQITNLSNPGVAAIKAEASDSDSGYDSPGRVTNDCTHPSTWEVIEAERKRGMRMAKTLAKQSELGEELKSDRALGRHHDGYGIEGVVATLAQLGRLSKYQLL